MVRSLPPSKYASTAKHLLQNWVREKNPFYASLKVTLRCQFTCDFCNIWSSPKYDLSTEDLKKIIRNLGRSSIVMTSFEGGEPLLRRDIEELLIEASKQPFYLMFTTSQRKLLSYPWEKYQKYIDFLEVSIDEGHKNLELFDVLHEINSYDMVVCVQTVVRKQDQNSMEEKVLRCFEAGCKILLMPATTLEGAEDGFPEFEAFEKEVMRLKAKYPRVIITPNSYFKRMKMKKGGCSPNSLVIDADGTLYYPCRTLELKSIKMQDNDLMEFINSQSAKEDRHTMANCERQCGWYQYFATAGFTHVSDFWDAFSPYFLDFMGKQKKVPQIPHRATESV